MLATLVPGVEHQLVHVVTADMGTSHAGPPLLSTPSMILMMEQTCGAAAAAHLEGEETTVGVHVNVSHVAAAVPGDEVDLRCRLVEVDRRFLTFEVSARVGDRLLGEGTHKRAVVDPSRKKNGVKSEPARPTLPQPTDDLEQARRDVDRWGYCLVAGALPPEQLQRIRARLVEQAAAEERLGVATFDSGYHPSKPEGAGMNQRVNGLVNKGEEFHEVALNPRIAGLLEYLLGPRFLLTSFTANITAPGCELQMLHQDQGYVNWPQPKYPIVTQVIWMLDDVTEHNGGTHVVPGSHLWEHPLTDPDTQTAILEAPAGTAAIVEGRCWHGAGANQSDRHRHVLLSNYCRAWVRQQENPFLGLAPEVEASLSKDMRRLLGFKTWGTLGGPIQRQAVDSEGFVSRPDRFVTRLA
ncbi:MAG: phytanoyl-CoA dioxygenase family protein [Acidimicrobiia bacterium]